MCREPFHEAARRVMEESMFGDLEGYIAAHSLTDLFYILRKDFDIAKRKSLLMFLCEKLQVIPENVEMIKAALKREDWKDLEDGLQMQCAKEKELDYIITRNIRDFEKSPVPVLIPEKLMEMYRGIE